MDRLVVVEDDRHLFILFVGVQGVVVQYLIVRYVYRRLVLRVHFLQGQYLELVKLRQFDNRARIVLSRDRDGIVGKVLRLEADGCVVFLRCLSSALKF